MGAGDDCGPSTATFEYVRNQVLVERDLRLTLSTIGPLYRITCTVEEHPEDGGDVCTILLGETDGFVVPPLKLMHCDTMRIYNSRLKSCKTDRRLGFMGLGRVMAQAVFAHGLEKGCEKAEILAINDDEGVHRKLVRYYERMGFEVECEVTGENLSDIFHLLVWGGVGTRMNADLRQVFLKGDQH
ncbi:hypothetical protein M9435_004787 [Picochlorum sp. BPE23]|nr:hypothetical protein M9435_004787 [Picochlorum sp. BPE23]